MSRTKETRSGWSRAQMSWCAAQDIVDGAYVNLGIGMPETVADFLPEGRQVMYHSENGIVGMGPAPAAGEEDPDLINAGKKPVTERPGAAYFHHADSFAMIRGGHIDVCILGAMQVADNGDLANWSTGAEDAIPAVGGAMDLAAGARSIYVITDHTTRSGEPKLVDQCSYPLTGRAVVKRVYTNLAIIDVAATGFIATALAPGVEVQQLEAMTTGRIQIAETLRSLDCPVL